MFPELTGMGMIKRIMENTPMGRIKFEGPHLEESIVFRRVSKDQRFLTKG